MTVFIVLRNGRVDEVFDDYEAARAHEKSITKKGRDLARIIEKEVLKL